MIVLRRQRNSLLLLTNLPRSKFLPHLRLRRLPRLGRRKLAFCDSSRLHNRHFRPSQSITLHFPHDGYIHVLHGLQLLYPRNAPYSSNRMYRVRDLPVWRCIFTRRRTRAVYILRGSISAICQVIRHVAGDSDDVVLQFYISHDMALSIIQLHDRRRLRVVRRLERRGLVAHSNVYA